jgi:hypothetical protein
MLLNDRDGLEFVITPDRPTLSELARILKCRTKIYERTRRRGQERSTKPLPVITVHPKTKRVRRKDLMDWLDGLVAASRKERQGAR